MNNKNRQGNKIVHKPSKIFGTAATYTLYNYENDNPCYPEKYMQ